jgi:hypothetical protein
LLEERKAAGTRLIKLQHDLALVVNVYRLSDRRAAHVAIRIDDSLDQLVQGAGKKRKGTTVCRPTAKSF